MRWEGELGTKPELELCCELEERFRGVAEFLAFLRFRLATRSEEPAGCEFELTQRVGSEEMESRRSVELMSEWEYAVETELGE